MRKKLFFIVLVAIMICSAFAITAIWKTSKQLPIAIDISKYPPTTAIVNNLPVYIVGDPGLDSQGILNRFDNSMLAIKRRAAELADDQFATDLVSTIRMLSAPSIESFLELMTSHGLEAHELCKPDNPFFVSEIAAYREFIYKIEFDANGLVIRDDPGHDAAKDASGAIRSYTTSRDEGRPFLARITPGSERFVEAVLPVRYIESTTGKVLEASLGFVLCWNPEVERWAVHSYRTYRDHLPASFPSPYF